MPIDTAARRVGRWLFRPVDGSSLAVFRISFGLLALVSTLRFFWFGWIDRFFVAPSFHFKYWGFSWVRAWPPWGLYLHFALLALLALAVTLGLFYRVAIVLFFLAFTYVQLIDVSLYLNHYYLVSLLAFLLVFLPAERCWSLDALRRSRTGGAPPQVPALAVYVLRFQIGLVYTCAGLAKLGKDWLLHGQPLNLWLGSLTDLPVMGPYLAYHSVALATSWAGFLFDTTIVAWLSWRKSRALAFLAVVVFHALTWLFFPIGMFPFIMINAATIFFAPEWPRRIAQRLRRLHSAGTSDRWSGAAGTVKAAGPPAAAAAAAPALRSSQRWALAAFSLYALVQLLLPFRYRLYGGNVLWHEQGLRFSWRVLVREKNGNVTFRVRAPATGRQWEVNASRYLQGYQESDISTQPDLIWQLAQEVGRQFDRLGHGRVEVRADVQVSLNGRPSAPLLDPGVDLRQVTDNLLPKPWILPAPTSPPPRLLAVQ